MPLVILLISYTTQNGVLVKRLDRAIRIQFGLFLLANFPFDFQWVSSHELVGKRDDFGNKVQNDQPIVPRVSSQLSFSLGFPLTSVTSSF